MAFHTWANKKRNFFGQARKMDFAGKQALILEYFQNVRKLLNDMKDSISVQKMDVSFPQSALIDVRITEIVTLVSWRASFLYLD